MIRIICDIDKYVSSKTGQKFLTSGNTSDSCLLYMYVCMYVCMYIYIYIYILIYLTANGLTPGCSSTVYIYT